MVLLILRYNGLYVGGIFFGFFLKANLHIPQVGNAGINIFSFSEELDFLWQGRNKSLQNEIWMVDISLAGGLNIFLANYLKERRIQEARHPAKLLLSHRLLVGSPAVFQFQQQQRLILSNCPGKKEKQKGKKKEYTQSGRDYL